MSSIRNVFVGFVLIASFAFLLAPRSMAQSLTTLQSFNGVNGFYPSAGLVQLGDTFYGTTYIGVFAIKTNGSGFVNLHTFGEANDDPSGVSTNADGFISFAKPVVSGDTLYGTAYQGGLSGRGTIFAVKTNGADFQVLHSFTANPEPTFANSDGASPQDGLILMGDTLYGTTLSGGTNGHGTVFSIKTTGTGFTTLHHFNTGSGGEPYGGLVLSGNVLYGTASIGGNFGQGTIFAVNTNGTGYTNLHEFGTGFGPPFTGGGAAPHAGLLLVGDTLFGTTQDGGDFGRGTVFAIQTNGASFTTLYHFALTDGRQCFDVLTLSGDSLYGTTFFGGSTSNGTIFAVNTNGTGFSTLHSFSGSDGKFLRGSLLVLDNALYGTTQQGGTSNSGTVFKFSLAPTPSPELTTVLSGTNIVLTWPTNTAGFTLQSTTNLTSPPTWSSNPPAPVVVNGKNTVTNAIVGSQKFYRLSQ